ncbi:unnamed protein product [Urochloa humidicola]
MNQKFTTDAYASVLSSLCLGHDCKQHPTTRGLSSALRVRYAADLRHWQEHLRQPLQRLHQLRALLPPVPDGSIVELVADLLRRSDVPGLYRTSPRRRRCADFSLVASQQAAAGVASRADPEAAAAREESGWIGRGFRKKVISKVNGGRVFY